MTDLATIQDWMQSALISRGDLTQKLAFAQHKSGLTLEDMILTNKGISAHERFDIYASGYVLRLLECMRADFPKLELYLGSELFDTFAKAYIVTIPSSSWNLYDLGAKFSNFLKQTQPKGESVLFSIPAELAHMERMQVESLQDEGVENITKEKSLNIFTQDIILEQVKSLRLIKQPYDLYEMFHNIEPLNNSKLPSKQESYLAITRVNYRVHIIKIQPWQYYFLEACKNQISLNNAIDIAAKKMQTTPKSLRAKLIFWLPIAQNMAFVKFSSVI